MSSVCEHGHQARKCEVCELKAELARLRGVCKDQAFTVLRMTVDMMNASGRKLVLIKVAETLAAEGNKSDGQ